MDGVMFMVGILIVILTIIYIFCYDRIHEAIDSAKARAKNKRAEETEKD